MESPTNTPKRREREPSPRERSRSPKVEPEVIPRAVLNAKQIKFLNDQFKAAKCIFPNGSKDTMVKVIQEAWMTKDVPKTFEKLWKQKAQGKRMPRAVKDRVTGLWDMLAADPADP